MVDDEQCDGYDCPLCDPRTGASHVFRKRDTAKDKRKRRAGRSRQEKRLLGRRKCRNTPCDCWLCQPGYMKRRILRERVMSRELRG